MMFALGAASAALNAVQSLSTSSTGLGQGSGDPFEVGRPASASARPIPTSGFDARSRISAATMNALFDTAGSAGTTSPGSATTSYQSAGQASVSAAPVSISA